MGNVHKNEVHIAGELAKDPIVRFTPSGKNVCTLSVVTKYKETSEFHRVVCWEALADKAEGLTKGQFVKVVGRLQTRSFDDKQTGQKRFVTEVVAFQLTVPGNEPAPLTADAISGTPKGVSDDCPW